MLGNNEERASQNVGVGKEAPTNTHISSFLHLFRCLPSFQFQPPFRFANGQKQEARSQYRETCPGASWQTSQASLNLILQGVRPKPTVSSRVWNLGRFPLVRPLLSFLPGLFLLFRGFSAGIMGLTNCSRNKKKPPSAMTTELQSQATATWV